MITKRRTTEEPGVWRLVHDTEPNRRITLEIFEGPGMRARTISIVGDGGILIDGDVVMSALAPRGRVAKSLDRNAVAEGLHLIAQEVEDASGVTIAELRGRSRHPGVCAARKVAIFLAVHRMLASQKEIGAFFKRDRSLIPGWVDEIAAQITTAEPENYGRGVVETSSTF